MLKKLALAQILMFMASGLLAQSAEDILKFAAKKEKERKYLRYTVRKIEKGFTDVDTATMVGTVSLSYIPGDTTDFAFRLYYSDTTSSFIYNGKDLYSQFNRKKDSTWIFYPGEIKPQGRRIIGTKVAWYYFPPASGSLYWYWAPKQLELWSRLPDTQVNGEDCYVLQLKIPDGKDSRNTRNEFSIRKKDGLTLRFRSWSDLQEMHQYHDLTLIETDQSPLPASLFELPPGQAVISEKEYIANLKISLGEVKKGQQAPSWKFVTLSGDSLALDSLKGKVVLLDFFYRACYPCMKAIPDLVKLQEKYKERGLVIVGIDPVDSAIVPTLADFLARRNVTYPVVISPKAYPRAVYGVQGYPHTFILDRNGRLVEQHVGWSEDMYATWEKTILELLE